MASTPFLALLGILIFAGASFFFALAETSLIAMGESQMRQVQERSDSHDNCLARLLAEPQDVLATIVLGNTFANSALVAIGLWLTLNGQWPLPITVVSLLLLVLVGGEVVPKTLAVRAPHLWSVRIARPMFFLQNFTRPLRRLGQRLDRAILQAVAPESPIPGPGFPDEEYQELLELAFHRGTLAQSEKEIILQIISLDRRTAREVMTPRVQMTSIDDRLSVEEMVTAAQKSKHRRLPIYDETPDTIVGVLNARALLLDPLMDLADAIEFPSFVPESMNLLLLLKSLQRQQRGLAIVLDEFGGTSGLITVEDILEEMIGEIRGEAESEGFVMQKLGEGRWRAHGSVRLDDFRREYPELGDVPEVETLGGLLMTQLEVVPVPGQSVTFRGLRLTAQITDERRVRELLVEVQKKR